jgi:hypothetical protein
MSSSIVGLLVKKDIHIMRGPIAGHAVVALVAIAVLAMLVGRIPSWVILNLGVILLVGPAITCGIVMLMKINVFEKEKSTQSFILSLPLTVREFTRAKVIANLLVFTPFWAVATGAAFYFVFGFGLLPHGAIPFLAIVFVGMFVAYVSVLAVSLAWQSLGVTVLALTLFEMATSGYLWCIAFLEPVRQHVLGPAAVWNTAAVAIVGAQALVVIAVLTVTVCVQGRKRDFI